MRPNIMTVYGTRPEAIKVAPVIRALSRSEMFESNVVSTGQHREMLDEVNAVFGIVPDHDLDVMRHGQSLSAIAARVLEGLDPVLASVRPDAVLVQGDTTTSTVAALAAFYHRIPVVHLEAGLRSHDMWSPFPEEANRRMTSCLAALHLAPTTVSKQNLVREGISEQLITVTGNTVIDALLASLDQAPRFTDPALGALESSGRRVLLVTTHRRESWGEAMHGVGRALATLARRHPDVTVLVPLHRNPVVRESLVPYLNGVPNVVVTEPLPYGEFTRALRLAHVVLTDSGGVQEEAPSLGKPVLVMRENTERPEAVTAGTVRLIGTDEDRVVDAVDELLTDESAYASMASAVNPYGDGRAAERSVAAIGALFGVSARLPEFTP